MINMDDLNAWVAPLSGHPQIKTPNLDRLAARGTVFRNAHTQAPVCNPSRASLFTGIRPENSGLYSLNPSFREAPSLRNSITLPQFLARNGYKTYTTGKNFHDGIRQDPKLPAEFTEWGFTGTFAPRPAKRLKENINPVPLIDWGVYPEKDEDQDDWKVVDWAVNKLKEPAAEPFFLAVGIRHPHVPMYASQRWFDLYADDQLMMPIVPDDDRDDLPKFSEYLVWRLPEPRLALLKRRDEWRSHVQAYLASVSFADHLVGRLLDQLDSTPAGRNTIIVFWSDHGYHNGEKGITGKNTLWEISTRVPIIISAPGFKAGQQSGQPVELLDLYPTIAELCGFSPPAHVEGVSLIPWLQNPDSPKEKPARTAHGPGNMSVRSKDWRYIRYADGSEELYDHAADPQEWHNLARIPAYAPIIREHARWLPRQFAEPVAGSRARLLEYRDGKAIWEGREVNPNDPFDYDPFAQDPGDWSGQGAGGRGRGGSQ
ncbi:MAG TPA: sulfatase [Opitutaceae bacterium]